MTTQPAEGCGRIHVKVDPLTKQVMVYLSNSLSFDDPKTNINNTWTLDN